MLPLRHRIALTLLVFFSSGCFQALSPQGARVPDVLQIDHGDSRIEIERILGAPVQSIVNGSGGRTDTYMYLQGRNAIVARKRRIQVEYDTEEKAVLIRQLESTSIAEPDAP